MIKPSDIQVTRGFEPHERTRVTEIYDLAFGAKIGLAIPAQDLRREVFAACLVPEFALVARRNGEVVGVAGVKTARGALTGGGQPRPLLRALGLWGTVRAGLVFLLFQRRIEAGCLLMDGIAVAPEARGLGVGTLLLDAVLALAEEEGCTSVRLDVIDTNPDARRLYERVGFVAVGTERFEPLRGVLGFGASTTMKRPCGQRAPSGTARAPAER